MSAATTTLGQLMERNAFEVFGEPDPGRRQRAIAELYAEDCAFYEADEESIGQAAISDRVGRILDETPFGLRVQPARPRRGDPRPSVACAGRPALPARLRS